MKTICQSNPECQVMLDELANAAMLSFMIIIAWRLARTIAVLLVEEVLTNRAQAQTEWGMCEKCGKRLQSKGFAPRQIKSVIGIIKWERRLGRCSNKCAIGQVAPLDAALGVTPNQKSDNGLQQMACLAAVFVPYEIAAMLLSQLGGITVSSQAIWEWVQVSGKKMIRQLEAELSALKDDKLPEIETMSAEEMMQTLLIGADGVMAPFRPQAKTAAGKTKWREIKVAIFARLEERRTRSGKTTTRLHRHRVAAVLGDVDQLSERMWLEALKQGITQAPQGVWLSDGGRGFWRLFDERFHSGV